MKNILSILAVLLISACAYTPQDAKLSAHAQIENSNIGAGTLIEVKVHDERTSKSLGHRGAAAFKGAKITTDQDIAALLHSALTEAYTKKGFVFNNSDNLIPAKIRVDLREFNYYTSTGFWTGGVHTKAAAKISLPGTEFEQMYSIENEERVVFVPGASKNEQLLNQTLSLLIEQIVNDPKLTNAIIAQKENTETPNDDQDGQKVVAEEAAPVEDVEK